MTDAARAGLETAAAPGPATQTGRDQLAAECQAIRLVARGDREGALPALEANWR